ncbi:23S rRNA (uracil(1939)-C(5))-methyltransferase RlmD [Edaphobacter bradus]|uniref:23S rRNA (uracil(1939)-C(5))-methyltransferase RlmD n=1 Tax=Edaphobacter bradus TaxID=2259016 RepID=UPI0021DFF49B|nr:23S rRNA (uracil(1939)-C(5))-methyltransferase RlmD [Edaphobacter bradus]
MKLLIEKVVYGGDGLARLSDGSVFVPFTLPGETVEAREVSTGGGRREAELVQVLQPSSARVAPECAHFGVCGGCQYQHATYDEQLAMKRAILSESLERAGLSELPAIVTHTAEPWGYRNRIRLRLAEVDGVLRVGYLRRGSSEFLPVQMCPIASPLLWRAAQALLTLLSEDAQWLRSALEVEFFTNAGETKLQMLLFVEREPAKGFERFSERLRERVPELVGAGVSVIASAGRNRKTQRMRPGTAWGADGMGCDAAGESYWVSRGAFFQVNRFLIDELVRLVTGGRGGSVAWDLFAGVGLFSRVLAKQFARVVAVEAAADDLARSFKSEGRVAVNATTVEFLRRAVLERERPELVVMDPPRAGVGAEVCALLARVCAPEMVYVSCDPVTLGRDLKAMVDSGYTLAELHMVDLFPQTFHQETVAVLRRETA